MTPIGTVDTLHGYSLNSRFLIKRRFLNLRGWGELNCLDVARRSPRFKGVLEGLEFLLYHQK